MKAMQAMALSLLLFLLVSCQHGPTSVAPATAAAESTPTILVVKTFEGVGKEMLGTLQIDGDCVRVDGEAVAWDPILKVTREGKMLRIEKHWSGEVVVLQAGDEVRIDGGCEFRGDQAACVTPSVEEKGATSGCETGPYFVTTNIRKIIPPTPPLPSP